MIFCAPLSTSSASRDDRPAAVRYVPYGAVATSGEAFVRLDRRARNARMSRPLPATQAVSVVERSRRSGAILPNSDRLDLRLETYNLIKD
jgi:hypothetical protein